MSRYRWIVFDADGTLFDFDTAERVALARTLRTFGIEPTPDVRAAYRTISIDLWADFERGEIDSQRLRVARFELLLGQFGWSLDPEEVSDHYIEALAAESVLLPDAASVVARLAGQHRLLLATNGIADVQRRRFERSTIRYHFTDVVISDEIGVAKPDPRYFDEAFHRMGHPARTEVLMVGDSLTSDVQGAAAYGVDTCWYNPNHSGNGSEPQPTYVICRLTDLFGITSSPRERVIE